MTSRNSLAGAADERICAGPREAYEIAVRDGIRRARAFTAARQAERLSQERLQQSAQELYLTEK